MIEKLRGNRGQTIVEFALILILFLMMVLGIIEYAIILYNKAILTDGCREGARAGVVFRADATSFGYSPLTENEIRTVVDRYIQNRLVSFGTQFNSTNNINVRWSIDYGATWSSTLPNTHGEGERLRVEVEFLHAFLVLPNLGNGLGGTVPLKSVAIMRME